jgi:hypothetical protein
VLPPELARAPLPDDPDPHRVVPFRRPGEPPAEPDRERPTGARRRRQVETRGDGGAEPALADPAEEADLGASLAVALDHAPRPVRRVVVDAPDLQGPAVQGAPHGVQRGITLSRSL